MLKYQVDKCGVKTYGGFLPPGCEFTAGPRWPLWFWYNVGISQAMSVKELLNWGDVDEVNLNVFEALHFFHDAILIPFNCLVSKSMCPSAA